MNEKNRILIVDDEVSFTEILRLNLEAQGKYEVCVENNPREALNAALNFKPEVVLLDVIMPHVEGPDVAREMKDSSSLKEVPIIFLTATITREEALSDGGCIGGQ